MKQINRSADIYYPTQWKFFFL